MKCTRETMLLYAVTDRGWTGRESLYAQVEKALKGGITCLQLREKSLEEEAFLQEAKHIQSLCRRYQVPLIINDQVEVALACSAEGIHVGQEDMDAGDVRRLVGEEMILGVSVHTVEEAKKAVAGGADYLGVGAVFSTATKTDASQVSIETLKAICSAADVPVVAIGGIHQGNMEALAGTGIAGVALVSAIFSAEDIEQRCRKLRKMAEKFVDGGKNK